MSWLVWSSAVAIPLLAATLVATGWWRPVVLGCFRIAAHRMTVGHLALNVAPEHTARVDAVLQAFAAGFNAMITTPQDEGWQRFCASLPSLSRPFAEEGVAMGYSLRHPGRFRAAEFETQLVRVRPGFRYLHYVGLGFWWGMRGRRPEELATMVSGLDPLYRFLCFDGYGFKHAFFDYPRDPGVFGKFSGLAGYARNAAYQGAGRALFFLFMDNPAVLIEHVQRLGPHAVDAASGLGLASVFIFHDRIDIAQQLATRLPEAWHASMQLGMCFGLKARSINDPQQFSADLGGMPSPVRDAVRAAVEACDRIEAEVRAAGAPDGYRCWREGVAAWMMEHLQYPLAGVRMSSAVESARAQSPGVAV
ncbi:MAG TPA: DUF1702 family protein [Phycisphaerae bacterium]|nr:DUF1702 family protein [Phycisphaerae bacterium]HNU44654.1 DUF1702 family protein [Phycisphaerae bacterium]